VQEFIALEKVNFYLGLWYFFLGKVGTDFFVDKNLFVIGNCWGSIVVWTCHMNFWLLFVIELLFIYSYDMKWKLMMKQQASKLVTEQHLSSLNKPQPPTKLGPSKHLQKVSVGNKEYGLLSAEGSRNRKPASHCSPIYASNTHTFLSGIFDNHDSLQRSTIL
jgi:hypothetical protein